MLPVRGASQSFSAPLDLISLALQALWTGKAAVAALGRYLKKAAGANLRRKLLENLGMKYTSRVRGIWGIWAKHRLYLLYPSVNFFSAQIS